MSPAFSTAAACAVAIAAAAWLDSITGAHLGFGIFYLIPVGVAAWYSGRYVGLALATFASLAWLAVDLLARSPDEFALSLWNAFSRLLVFLLVALLLAAIRADRAALQHANARLLAQNRDLDAFAGRVAHDLRNALAPLGSAALVLRSGELDPAQRQQLVRLLQNSTRNASRIIDALLTLARSDQNVAADERAGVAAVLRGVLEELAPTMQRLDVAVEVRVPDALAVRCAPGLLHIVLANVVGNAVKFMEGSAVRRVQASAGALVGEVWIEVSDSGPGIPEADQARIFQAFVRGSGTTAQGTGIGLATVERIVHARGGHVSVRSAPGQGATFRISLPPA